MKSFKKYLNEEGSVLGYVTLPPTEKPISIYDESRRRLAFEREVMGMTDKKSQSRANEIKSLNRLATQVEYETERKSPDEAIDKLNDIDLRSAANKRIQDIDQAKQVVGNSILDVVFDWAKGNAEKASNAANERLKKNPTYKYSQTKNLQGEN